MDLILFLFQALDADVTLGDKIIIECESEGDSGDGNGCGVGFNVLVVSVTAQICYLSAFGCA